MTASKQLDFMEDVTDHRTILPSSKAADPVIWVQRVLILKQLDVDPQFVIRDIRLHRGLNILWATPEDASVRVQLYGDGLSGHASGKTTFCRIVRHLLGEANYGNDALRAAVDEHFDELWTLGEVFVSGRLWLVARSLKNNQHSFAIPDVSADDYLKDKPAKGKIQDYLDAVEKATCGTLPKEAAGGTARIFTWRHLQPWLTRDQECRYASIHDWRNPSSGADNPQTSVTDQQALMRAVLSLLNEEEDKERRSLDDMERERKQKDADLPRLHDRFEVANQRVKALFPDNQDKPFSLEDENRLEPYEKGAKDTIAEINKEIRKIQSDPAVTACQKAAADAAANLREAKIIITLTEADIQKLDERIRMLQGRIEEHKQGKIENVVRKAAGYCPHSLQVAIEKGCTKPPSGASPETCAELGILQLEAEDLEKEKKAKEQQVQTKRKGLPALEKAIKDADDALKRANATLQKKVSEQFNLRREIESKLERIADACSAQKDLDLTKEKLKSLLKDCTKAKEVIVALRKENEKAVIEFSEIFADVIRAVMGPKVEASATLNERGIALKVERNGDLYGAALETIKVLAFDIASLTTGIEGKSQHPRFLIHDAPREADMSRVIYERFFLYVRKLEAAFGKSSQPNFQYLITTTTPPPPDMQQGSNWMLDPILNATTADTRLLKADL